MIKSAHLSALIKPARELIERSLPGELPVLLYSGGKDSTVLLHLVTQTMGIRVPILFHREPYHLHKFEYALKVLSDWGLTAHDYPPERVTMWEGKGIVAYTNHYRIASNGGTMDLPKNIVEIPEDTDLAFPVLDYLCGKDAFLCKLTGIVDYPWTLCIHGHKNSDEDQIAGKVPIHVDRLQNVGAPDAIFPLRHWTDDDVFDYLNAHPEIPLDDRRYSREHRGEFASKTYNSDYHEACIRCIDIRKKGQFVHCPKTGGQVNNIADQVPYSKTEIAYYGEKPPAS